ncbi:MAG TPA: hypothetical protein VJB88_14940 [Vicinamibacteria bacterium]|nr:hypothetical protein [Vicinamibacteria bacterium]
MARKRTAAPGTAAGAKDYNTSSLRHAMARIGHRQGRLVGPPVVRPESMGWAGAPTARGSLDGFLLPSS